MNVRIYRPAKTAMQSGRAKTHKWVLEYEDTGKKETEPLMGWTSCDSTLGQVRIVFDTRERAIAFAKSKGWTYCVSRVRERKVKPRNYSDNFRYFPPEDKTA